MPELVWDQVGDRTYQSGIDKGVLYLPDGSAVPWNGLTSVIENFDSERSPVYFDGMKINDLVVLGDFSATMKAITYPDEFVALEGATRVRRGFFLADQRPRTFGLCYRTGISTDLEPNAGYQIHILYNVTAIPSSKTYETLSESQNFTEFEWNIAAIPEEVPGYRPTAHIIINSTDFDSGFLAQIEAMLYGSTTGSATLIPMPELVNLVKELVASTGITIVNHGDGTWTATSPNEGDITFPNLEDPDYFLINNINMILLATDLYRISDSDIEEEPLPEIMIYIEDLGDGSWSASTTAEGVITVDGDGVFTITNANVTLIGSDSFQISDTV